MLDPQVMNDLLASQLFRAVLAARTDGIASDTPEQHQAASSATEQIERVRSLTKGSLPYLMATGILLRRLSSYLAAYGETDPPHLPAALRGQ